MIFIELEKAINRLARVPHTYQKKKMNTSDVLK